jgi:hypothetical protein
MLDTVSRRKEGIIPQYISREQAKDTGMAAVLVCLILTQITQKQYFMVIAIILLLGNMVWPDLYRPVAKLWLGFSHFLGTYMSKLILAIIFTVLVIPVGVVRRLAGADALQLRKWKESTQSVFKVRDHRYEPDEIEKPY